MLDQRGIARVREAVRPLEQRLEMSAQLDAYASHRYIPGLRHPVAHIEDVSGIPFVSLVPGVEEYQHRARVRAGTGDLFAAVTPPTPGFEDYCRDRLGLGAPEFVLATPGDHAFAVASACATPPAFDSIVARAREAGGLTLHPYMAITPVWDLAAALAHASGTDVRVLGPPPPVLWLANDKALLSETVCRVLSPDWIVETHTATRPAEMAEQLIRVAQRHGKAGLKRTRCASAMGNAVFDLRAILEKGPDDILDEVRAFLEKTEWAVDEEVLIVAWQQVDDSPSTQLWIPPIEQGIPRVEGVYEQLLEGEERVFLGSRPSLLSDAVNRTLADVSLQVGVALQSMGYVGRCSFDFIIVPDGTADGQPKFTECNGRWGGTSTPMYLVDRLVEGPRPTYWAQDYMHRELVGVSFAEVLKCVGDALYDPSSRRGRYVFYNVGPLERSGKLDVIAFGETPEEAEASIQEDLPRRLGLR